MLNHQPRLTCIEAGPGEVDLITVKGLKFLRTADVVLYDATVNEVMILEYAPPKALKVFVGQRRNKPGYSEEDIHEIIVEYAETYGHVVLLKGKSPIPVTGFDTPAIRYAKARGLHTEYIPGVPDITAIHKNNLLPRYSKN
jgi:uroporphyrin-III C-methyltransferase